jgi:transcriptional regulator with XRE-family HTH domain
MGLEHQLVRARELIGYSQEAVAAALGVSRAMVSYWESGKRRPNDRQLAALARVLHTTVSELLSVEESAPTADIAEMLFRGAEGEPPQAALGGLREFISFLDNYARLAEAADFPVRGLRQSPFTAASGFDSLEDVRRKAEEVRAHLRIGLGPIGDMDDVCDLLGITVFRAALGEDLFTTISGAFFNHPVLGFCILVNLQMTPGRRRFTIAHEVAHALFHSEKNRFVISSAHKDPQERFADAFAGELLMPTAAIRRVMEEQGIGPRVDDPIDVIHLQRFFKVSFETALVRLRQAKLLRLQDYDHFKLVRPVVLARSLGYDVEDEEFAHRPEDWRIHRFPPRFLRLLRIAARRDIVSVPTAAGITGLSIDEVADLASDEVPRLDHEPEEITQFEVSGVLGDR